MKTPPPKSKRQVSNTNRWRPWLLRGGIACFVICIILFLVIRFAY